jgi:electron transfer flavoprotein alpha subunit
MAILVLAEHNNAALAAATLNTVAAAQQIGGDVHILVAGSTCAAVAEAAAKVAGVAKVLVADHGAYANQLPENLAPLVAELGKSYSHVLAPATTNGKNLLPRVAALLDVDQISEIVKVLAPDTFQRPIYAGNAIATVQSGAAVKVITVRGTGFDAVAAEGGSASRSYARSCRAESRLAEGGALRRHRSAEFCDVAVSLYRARRGPTWNDGRDHGARPTHPHPGDRESKPPCASSTTCPTTT